MADSAQPRDRQNLAVRCIVGGAALLVGCEPAVPQPRHLAETNQLITQRTGEHFDAGELLQLDLQHGETPPTGVLTLDDAVARTLRRNYSLVATVENVAIARAQVAQASLIQNPTLGQSSGLLFPLSAHMGLPTFDINIQQTINSILTQPARVRTARLQELQAQIDVASQAFSLYQQAQSKYQEMAHLVRSRRIAERTVEVYGRAVKAAEARQQVGLIPVPELNRARLNYTDALRQERHLQTQYQRAAQEMNWLMGISSVPQWTLPDTELQPPQKLPAAPRETELENMGLKYRLDLLRAEYDRQLGAFGVRLARLGLFPQLNIGAEFARDGNKKWSAGPFFNLTLPIFDPGLVALRLAEEQQRKADKTYLALQGQVRQDVRTAVANFQIARDDLTFFREKLVPQQEQNVNLMQESFRLGNDDLDALLNALRDYVTALQSYEDTTQAYQTSAISLQAAVGSAWEDVARQQEPATMPATTQNTASPATQP